MSHRIRLLFFIAVIAGIVAICTERSQGMPEVATPSIESDLQLHAVLKRGDPLAAGSSPWIETFLVNTSAKNTHRIVKPGHGSEIPTREPFVTWTATIDRGDGKPAPVTDKFQIGYCGTCLAFSADWSKDTIAIAPGERLAIEMPLMLDFQQAGRVRLHAHYQYHAITDPNDHRSNPKDIAFMTGVPAFKLESNPIEFDVVRPFDVSIRVLRPLKVRERTRISDFLDITLKNQTAFPFECSSTNNCGVTRVSLEIQGGWAPRLTEQATTYGIRKILQPGEEVPLLGSGVFQNGADGFWTSPATGTIRIRAVYMATDSQSPGTSIRSPWVELQIVD